MLGGLKSLAQPVADTIHRIRAILAQVYGVYPLGGTNGGIVIRRNGGIAGTNEASLAMSAAYSLTITVASGGSAGQKLIILCRDRNYEFTDGTDSGFKCNAGAMVTGELRIGSGSRLGHSSASSPAGAAADTYFTRADAGVYALTSWLQQVGARSRVSSAVTNTTITPAAITGLSATLIAGRKYTGRLVLYASIPTSADGIRIDFDGGTATMTSFIAQGVLSDDTSTRKLARTTALATDITDTDLNGEGYIVIEFGLVCNGAGTFIPRIAKEADAAGDTLTVTANSFMWLEDMP